MHQKKYLLLKETFTRELLQLNSYIEKVESYTAITAPESSLGTIPSQENPSDVELKRSYVKKRKVMNFLERLSNVESFLCCSCGRTIELERLYLMQKASFCEACASENSTS